MAEYGHLIVLTGTQEGLVVPVKGTISIGRSESNTLRLTDLQVSRRHAVVQCTSRGVLIRDLESGNGLYVQGVRITEHFLQDGDIIRLGKQQVQYHRPEPQELGSMQPPNESSEGSGIESKKADTVYKTFFQSPRASASAVELKEIQKRLQAVYAANQAIAGELSLEQVFKTVIDEVFSLVKAHNGLILLKQEDKTELSVEYVKNQDPGETVQVSSSIIARVFENGEAIITSNAAEGAGMGGGQSIIAQNISSSMCVPLTHRQECLGVIYVDNRGLENAFTHSDLELLVALAASAASAIKNAQYLKQIEQSYQDTLVALANAIELRDHYTVGHTWRVTNIAMEMARELGWSEEKIKEVQMGGVLHDVGKIAVDNAILCKPAPLDDDEFAQMKVHPERGADLLRDIKFLNPLIPYCLYHHEKWDGSGYPFGLEEEYIPEEGRLIAVADAFDAMTSTRPYRKGMEPTRALEKIIENKGTQFDPVMVDALERSYHKGKIDQILQDYNKNEAHSISCPFCSTYIRFDQNAVDGSQIQCNVCHKTIYLIVQNGRFFGNLTPPNGVH
ncbi:MAG: HD domain-containing protein [Candidatus Hydrogenedens sp.]|jgi:putative nucleotidyltransferase with HDIG domain|nr:HD domain-containing protein [Candidatus Hydrogenedens sp.]